MPRDHLQRIAHLVSLVLARGLGEQIELQRAAGRDHGKGRVRLLGSGRERMGFEKFPDDGVPDRANIKFGLSQKEAEAFASKLKVWCSEPEYAFVWKGD